MKGKVLFSSIARPDYTEKRVEKMIKTNSRKV